MEGRYIPADEPIDLLNVAFENPRKQGKKHNQNRQKKRRLNVEDHAEEGQDVVSGRAASYLVPDRETGLEGVAELRRLCPHRIWNFVSATEAAHCWPRADEPFCTRWRLMSRSRNPNLPDHSSKN